MPGPTPEAIRAAAHEAGFDLVGFGPAEIGEDADRFAAWLDAGRAGSMAYLERNRARIADPGHYAPGARSTISLGVDYGRPAVELEGGGRVARYAAGRDYHRVLDGRLHQLRQALHRQGVTSELPGGSDALPVLERALAARAGLGFVAKSTGVIAPAAGPYLLLAELLAPFEIASDGPSPGSCGTCSRCLQACPTGALVAPFELDARRCLSYTTIELRGPIPVELRAPQGEWLFGCDVCLEVCPFTSKGGARRGAAALPDWLRPHPVVESFAVVEVLALDERTWQEQWVGTAMRRATRSGLRRNAAVVLGNLGDLAAVPALERALDDADPVLRGHAAWALGRLAPGSPALRAALARETDATARAELHSALEGSPPTAAEVRE